MKKTLKGLGLITIVMLIMLLGIFSRENLFKKEELKTHDTVEETIYDKYFSKTGHDKDYYEIKTYWKDGNLQYVTAYYTGMIEYTEKHYATTYAVEVFDKELNRVKGFGAYNYEEVWKEAYNVIEGL